MSRTFSVLESCISPGVLRGPSIVTPDAVQTRIGTLQFFDGLPDPDTVQKVYGNLDFARGVEAFLIGMPAASVQALKAGFTEAGYPPNQGIWITEQLADARAVFFTPNATVVYQWACVDIEAWPVVVEVPPGVLGLVNDAYFRHIADMGVWGAIVEGRGVEPGVDVPLSAAGLREGKDNQLETAIATVETMQPGVESRTG